jgi:hypothetical protein
VKDAGTFKTVVVVVVAGKETPVALFDTILFSQSEHLAALFALFYFAFLTQQCSTRENTHQGRRH